MPACDQCGAALPDSKYETRCEECASHMVEVWTCGQGHYFDEKPTLGCPHCSAGPPADPVSLPQHEGEKQDPPAMSWCPACGLRTRLPGQQVCQACVQEVTWESEPDYKCPTCGASWVGPEDTAQDPCPPYYRGPHEPLKVADAWGLSLRLGYAIKYICRRGKKPGSDEIEDLKKARNCLDLEIKLLEKAGGE